MRIVAASLRPLDQEIALGRFREDLFFRVNTVTLNLPPLRERREDIPLLCQVLLKDLTRDRQKPVEGLDAEVLALFDEYPWPGNVRELRNVLERSALFCAGDRITRESLPAPLRALPAQAPAPTGGEVPSLETAVKKAELEAIRAALEATHGRRGEAAELLGVSRKTLWEKMRLLGLSED